LAGDRDEAALLAMADRAEDAFDEPRFIHALSYCLDASDRWTLCAPKLTAKVSTRFHNLTIRSYLSLYSEQKARLEKEYSDANQDTFVSSYKVIARADASELTSVAAWTLGIVQDLPRTDKVVFVGEDRVLGDQDWPTVEGALSRYMER